MEKQEKQLVERILGKDFLKAAETYGSNMRKACALQGANAAIQETFERIATVGFCKGAEFYRCSLWHKLAHKYPSFNVQLLCRSKAGQVFVAKVVKLSNGNLQFVGEDGKPTIPVEYWMHIPEVENPITNKCEIQSTQKK